MKRVDTTKLLRRLNVSLIVSALAGVQVASAQPKNEFFGGNSSANSTTQKGYTNFQGPAPKPLANGVTAKGAGAMDSDNSPEVAWFEKFDEISFRGRPTDYERAVLNMPFNQEAERVQSWTRTASNVAKRYRLTARALQTVYAPRGRADLDDYRSLRISWFNDAALVYEEMIKPRQPAQTIEDLKDQLRQVKEQAESIGKTNITILAMDRNLRRTYRVHSAKQTDSLTKYVTGQYPKN